MVSGKTIVVTGAGAGLGRAYARALAAAGARVVVNDVDRASAERVAIEVADAGGQAVTVPGSVAAWADAERLIRSAREWHGTVDGVVNNAGILHFGDWADESEDALRRIVDVNVLGSMFVCVHAMRAMTSQPGGGAILNVISGAHLGMPKLTAYGATKGAIASLTYGLALEGRSHGIRVNALSPLAATTIGGSVPAADAGMPAPEQIAPAVVYLMGDAATHLSGQIVRYDGRTVGLLDPARFGAASVADVHSTGDIAQAFTRVLDARLTAPGLTLPD